MYKVNKTRDLDSLFENDSLPRACGLGSNTQGIADFELNSSGTLRAGLNAKEDPYERTRGGAGETFRVSSGE